MCLSWLSDTQEPGGDVDATPLAPSQTTPAALDPLDVLLTEMKPGGSSIEADGPVEWEGSEFSVAIGFDGSNVPPEVPSNVQRFLAAYQGRHAAYVRGTGTSGVEDYDGVVSGQGWEERVDAALRYVHQRIENNPTQTLVLDTVGFSRGAAEARIFLHRLKQSPDAEHVRMRFLGLIDTVATYMQPRDEQVQLNRELEADPSIPTVQLAADNEQLRIYPLHSIAPGPGRPAQENGALHEEIRVPGRHPDLGGHHPGPVADMTLRLMSLKAACFGVPVKTSSKLAPLTYVDVPGHGWWQQPLMQANREVVFPPFGAGTMNDLISPKPVLEDALQDVPSGIWDPPAIGSVNPHIFIQRHNHCHQTPKSP